MKGLSFTPAPSSNEVQLRQESSEFTRKLRLKEYFVDKNNEFIPNDVVRPKSDFTPKSGRVPELDDISSEIETMKIKEKRFRDNLPNSERKALIELRKNDDIVIKGGTVVIMTKTYYYEMVMEHLRDRTTYEESETEDHDKRVMELIKEYADQNTPDILTGKENECISDFIPTSSKFYCPPKIHKSKEIQKIMKETPTEYLNLPEPPIIPGRPIVGGPNCPTNKLSNLMDLILKPLVYKVKSYVKDSFHFLEMLPKKIDFESTFVTFDITSLYTNISHDLGLEAISYWIDKYPEYLIEYRFTKEFVIRGLELILTLNYFVFNGKWYLQIKGCAMGTKVAVVLAILTVGYLEIKLYTILPDYFTDDYSKYIIAWWKRFIDDCFVPWKKGENLDLFVEILDTLHPSIKFTKEEGDLSIAFLDIMVIKAEDDTIEPDIFYKETNAHRYLHFQSAHPHKIKRNIPFTLAQRITRIVSDKIRCEQRLSELAHFLKKCNYPEDLIAKNIERVKQPIQRNEEMLGIETDTLAFVTTYSPSLACDENYIRKRLQGVQTDRLKKAFNNTRLVFAKRQPMNLKRLLTSSVFSSTPIVGDSAKIKHCTDKRCQLCTEDYLKIADKIFSPTGRLLFTIKYNFTCKSKNILYYMVCTICGEDYVGQTKDFRKRMNNHKSDIRGTPTAETLGVDKHIHYCQLQKYNTFRDPLFRVIPFLTVKDQKRRECLEKYYIRKFDTTLNEKDTL